MNNLEELRKIEKIRKCNENIKLAVNDMVYHTKKGDERDFDINLLAGLKAIEVNMKELRKLRKE